MSHAVKTLPLALAFALASGPLAALGLGPIEVRSQLNQPLLAEIPLIGARPADLEVLSVRLASPEAFQRVGLPMPAGTTANLQFSVGRNARGEPVVRVTTPGRVQDPFVSFLLEADWGMGSMVREFTVLIDPPHIAAATVTPLRAATVAAPATPPVPVPPPPPPPATDPLPEAPPTAAASLPEPPATPAPAPPPPAAPAPAPTPPPPAAPAPAPEPPPVPAAVAREHRVAAGQTLWSIAAAHREEASAAQMMLAIQRANPEAFARGNINLLRSGAVLRIPTPDEARSLARLEAEAVVREQMAAWRALSGAPAPAPTPVEGAGLAASPPPRPAAAPAGAPPATGRLEIAPPLGEGPAGVQTGARAGGEGAELRAELQQTREELAAREAELRELRSRLTEQEALASEQQRLIQLKDSQLSALEETLRQQREAAAAAAGTEAPADAVVVTEAPVDALPPTPAAVDAPTAEPTATAGTAEPPGPWWRQPMVLGAAGLVLVGGLLALLLRRRNAVAKPLVAAVPTGRGRLSDDPDLFTGLPGAARPGSAAPEPADTTPPEAEAPAPLADPGVSSPDPLAAPSPTAHDAFPQDLETHVALLRRHYNAGDAVAFLAAAEAMRAQVADTADPRWREVVVMGMGLVPGHALFREVLWNPVRPTDLQVREPDPGPVPAPPVPDAEDFADATVTARRPAAALPATPAPEDLDDTRLELAKAYIEIGDAEGARGMLEEVIAEGSPAARAEAERLLKSLG